MTLRINTRSQPRQLIHTPLHLQCDRGLENRVWRQLCSSRATKPHRIGFAQGAGNMRAIAKGLVASAALLLFANLSSGGRLHISDATGGTITATGTLTGTVTTPPSSVNLT